MSAENPYDDLIMEHIRNARNYRIPADATLSANGMNPVCGDELTLYVKVVHGCIEDIAFQCACCGVSMASASIMTERLKSLTLLEARAAVQSFLSQLGEAARAAAAADIPFQAIVRTARRYPVRARCAALPWKVAGELLEASASGPT